MRVGIISVFSDHHRLGRHYRGLLQPQVGPLIAALLPDSVDCEIVNDAWTDPDWSRHYDLLFLSCLHSDFDRARRMSHYWRRRGAKTVLGGSFASMYPGLCEPYFDAVVVGDPEPAVPVLYRDFVQGRLAARYVAAMLPPRAPPTPRFDLMFDQQFLPITLEVTRGCPFSCRFCALTGVGTRHALRPVEDVVSDIQTAMQAARRSVSPVKRRVVMFTDNNIGGNLPYLRALCAALEPLYIRWGSCATFNVVCQEELVAAMARAGCRSLFVGLESFSDDTLQAMAKPQNVVRKTREAIDRCLRHGISLVSGIMLSPGNDTLEYIETIPQRLEDCGLIMPTFICFETPLPGTPHFEDYAHRGGKGLLPNVLLQDCNGYTLVTQPQHASAEAFVAAYRRLHREVYCMPSAVRKLAHDLPRLLRGGPVPMVLDTYEALFDWQPLVAGRSYIAGSEPAYPESVPLSDDDFDSEAQRLRIENPWRITDADGKMLPMWRARERSSEEAVLVDLGGRLTARSAA